MAENKDKGKFKEHIRFRDLPLERPPSGPEETPPGEAPSPPAPRPEAEPPQLSEALTEAVKPPQMPPAQVRFAELADVADQVKPGAAPPEPAGAPPEEEAIPPVEDDEEPKILYENLYEATRAIYQAAAQGSRLNIAPLGPLAEALTASLRRPDLDVDDEHRTRPSLFREVMVTPIPPMDWAAHAIHVATLAVKLALGLEYHREELEKLALAGLLHGVGMMSLPRSLLEQEEPLSPQQRSVIESHPIRGAELLSELGPQFEWLSTVVLHEHERYRGQGYPNKLEGNDIHEGARVIGLVDSFIAMTQPRSWRPARTPHEAAKEIVFTHKDEFDLRLIKLFLQKMTIFPVNSLVKLSNNEIVQILAIHEDAPLRPTVETIQAPHEKHPPEPRVLDLRNHPLLYIISAVSERELERHQ